MCKIYPRVLIVNQQSIKKNNATGITLRSLWGDWPNDSVMEVFIDGYTETVHFRSGFRSFCLPSTLFSKIAHSKKAQKTNSRIKRKSNHSDQSFKTWFRQVVVLINDMLIPRIPSRIKKIVKEFKPQVVYTLGGSVGALGIAKRIGKAFGLPIIIHYMDNWPERLQWESNSFTRIYRKALNRQHKKCLLRSRVGLAISPQMADAYQLKFKMPFDCLMNSVDCASFFVGPRKTAKPYIFVYAGGLHLNRWKALQEIDRAIAITGIQAELHIYTSDQDAEMYRAAFSHNALFHKSVEHSKILSVYETADLLIHAECGTPLLLGFFKYSISTKIPEYLSSGRPMLFYGPTEMGLYNYLKTNNAAFVAHDFVSLCLVLPETICNDRATTITTNARRLASKNHSLEKNEDRLYNAIEQSIAAYNDTGFKQYEERSQ